MTQEINKAAMSEFLQAVLKYGTQWIGYERALMAYEAAKVPRTITQDKFERVVDAIAYEMSKSSVRGSKAENAAHAVLATLGITVGD